MVKKQESVIKDTKIRKGKFYAVIYNGNQMPHIEKIPKNVTHFKALNRRFNFDISDIMIFKYKTLFRNKFYIFYDIDNPDPLQLDKTQVKPKYINSDVYNSIIETEIVRQANNRGMGSLLDKITIQHVVVGVIILGVGIYLLSGGSVT